MYAKLFAILEWLARRVAWDLNWIPGIVFECDAEGWSIKAWKLEALYESYERNRELRWCGEFFWRFYQPPSVRVGAPPLEAGSEKWLQELRDAGILVICVLCGKEHEYFVPCAPDPATGLPDGSEFVPDVVAVWERGG